MKFDFQRPPAPLPRAESWTRHASHVNHSEPPRKILGGLFAFGWMLLRIPVFLVLYWLRLPVMVICNAVSIPALFAFLFSWFAFPDKPRMIVALAVASFGALVVQWVYDYVLMLLSPQDMMKIL